jgi:beta-lactamase regulating signal transducer with metallopeptidase domain
MQALTNSAFLQALGYAIANSLWQMALLWIVFLALTSFIKMNAANKYRLAVTAQLLGFAWFAVTLQFFYAQCSESLRQSTAFVSRQHFNLIVPEAGTSFQSNLMSFLLKGEQFLPYLSAAYLLLLVFLIIKWTRSYNLAQDIRHNGLHKIDIEWKLFIKNIAGQLGIKKDVKIHLSELVKTPMTIGFFKPIILVPLASINNLSMEQMEAVLLHEMAHIKRFDYLLNLLLSMVETALFFNPFTQLLSKHIKKERENSCDDWVLQFQYNPSMYAEALLRIAYMQSSPAFAMTLVRKNKNDLLSRVKRMIDRKESRFNYRNQLLALLLMTFIFSSVAWLQPMNKNHNATATNAEKQKMKKTLVKVPTLANIDNPLFNPVFFLKKPMEKEIEKAVEQANHDMLAAKQDEDAALNEMATIMPVAAKNLEDINWEEVDKDVQENMKTIVPKTISSMQGFKLSYDTLLYKNVFDGNYSYSFNNDEFKKGWQQLTDEMKKVGIELEKAMKTRNAIKIKQWQKQQAELNKSLVKLNDMNAFYSVPYLMESKANFKMAQGQNALTVAEIEKQHSENAKLHNLRVMETSQRDRARADSMKVHYTTGFAATRPSTSRNRLFVAKDIPKVVLGKPAKPKEMPICFASNIIPEVVPSFTTSSPCEETTGYSYSYNTKKTTPVVKATASKVNISTTVDTKKTLTGTNQKSKRYEIVITNKNGEEKKLVVVVED